LFVSAIYQFTCARQRFPTKSTEMATMRYYKPDGLLAPNLLYQTLKHTPKCKREVQFYKYVF